MTPKKPGDRDHDGLGLLIAIALVRIPNTEDQTQVSLTLLFEDKKRTDHTI